MSRVDRANNILSLLLTNERLAEGDIAFVAHSFGGLILEQILRVAHDLSPRQPDAANFVQRVSRIAFLGTPHRGADLATWTGILRLLICPSPAVRGLARNNPSLQDLNVWFRGYAADNGIAIKTLIETKSILGFHIVPPDSADPGLLSTPIPLDADHLGIASPASRESEAYLHIKNFLKAPVWVQTIVDHVRPRNKRDFAARGGGPHEQGEVSRESGARHPAEDAAFS